MRKSPNVILILNDDMGYSDIGCYGGEIRTPNLDRLASNGLRFTQFYNTARCSPSRASLLTGLHPHQTGVGILTYDTGPDGYPGNLNRRCVTIAEVLRENGYRTYMSGKWHVASELAEPSDAWPCQRGFDRFYGTIIGAGSYFDPNTLTRNNENTEHEARTDGGFFYTEAITAEAVRFIRDHARECSDQPFFHYVAFTAPHWPLHAHEGDIARYRGRFDEGWDQLREQRLERMVDAGLIDPSWKLTDRDPTQPEWDQAESKEWQLRRMETYAAQIDRMDQGIGQIVAALEETGQLADTVILFLSDNGACAEDIPEGVPVAELVDQLEIARSHTRDGRAVKIGNCPDVMPGGEDTYQSYGTAWANLSNTPFRLYKHWVHEGGIATPLIVHWPSGISAKGELRHAPGQLPDIMATVLDITGAVYPERYNGHEILPVEGSSLAGLFEEDSPERGPLFWEHEGNAAVRVGKWKLVREYPGPWELYDMDNDRTEMTNVVGSFPERVLEMRGLYEKWAGRSGVKPRERLLESMEAGEPAFWEK
jgi:arylsulfatase